MGCETGEEDRISEFDLKLMQIESEHMEVPEQHYKVTAKMPSAEFQKICRDLKEFGETMQIKASKEGITFSVQGDMGSGNVMLKPRESDKPEEKVSLSVLEPVTATFALRYLVNFAKAAPLCGTVELGLGPDAPLLVRYNLENADNGHLQFYLAPKLTSETVRLVEVRAKILGVKGYAQCRLLYPLGGNCARVCRWGPASMTLLELSEIIITMFSPCHSR